MAVIEDPNKIIEGPNIITRDDYPEGYTGAMLTQMPIERPSKEVK